MKKTEALARVAMIINGHGDGSEVGVFLEGNVVACKMVYKLLMAMPGVKAEVERLCDAQQNKNRALLFRGFEHEMPEEMQIEVYGRVVKPHTAAAGSTR